MAEESAQSTNRWGDQRRDRRRTQGREAQRRFRLRKEQTIHDLQAENEVLQDVIEEMSTTFLQFGDRLWVEGLLSASKPLANEWKESLATILGLAEKAQMTAGNNYADEQVEEEQQQQQQQQSSSSSSAIPSESTSLSRRHGRPSVTNSALIPSRNPTDANFTRSLDDLSLRMREITEQSRRDPRLVQATSSSIRPSLTRLPTLNPVMSDDYEPDPRLMERTNISFASRLCRAALLRAYRSLDIQRWGHEHNPFKDWMASHFQYSLPYSSHSTLLSNARAALNSLVTQDDDDNNNPGASASASPSATAALTDPGLEYKRLRLSQHFHGLSQQRIGLETRQRMTADGVLWQDVMDAEQVEDYLTKSGVVWSSEQQVQLLVDPVTVSAFTGTQMISPTPVVATIQIEVLIDKLVETSLDLGDGVGFSRHVIDEAVVSATVLFE